MLQIYAPTSPTVHMSAANGTTVKVEGRVDLHLQFGDLINDLTNGALGNLSKTIAINLVNDLDTILSADFAVEAEATVTVQAQRVVPQLVAAGLDSSRFAITLGKSRIGPVDVKILLGPILGFVAKHLIVPAVNKHLSAGIKIPPFKGANLSDTALRVKDGYLQIDTDVQYAPPKA